MYGSGIPDSSAVEAQSFAEFLRSLVFKGKKPTSQKKKKLSFTVYSSVVFSTMHHNTSARGASATTQQVEHINRLEPGTLPLPSSSIDHFKALESTVKPISDFSKNF